MKIVIGKHLYIENVINMRMITYNPNKIQRHNKPLMGKERSYREVFFTFYTKRHAIDYNAYIFSSSKELEDICENTIKYFKEYNFIDLTKVCHLSSIEDMSNNFED